MEAGWAYSNDYSGGQWTANSMTGGTQFGNPGISPVNGSAFAGWRSDPSIAPITNPDIGFTGNGLIYTMIGATTADPTSDVVMALSVDSGQSWRIAAYVTTAGTGQSVDNPVIASNPSSPYGTWVAWQQGVNGWIRKVGYSTGGIPSFGGLPIAVPAGPEGRILHPNVTVGRVLSCDGTGTHEGVYVAFAIGATGRCLNTGFEYEHEKWYIAIFDTVNVSWYGPWLVDSDDNYPLCVGAPAGWVTNDVRPRLALNDAGTKVWISHTHNTSSALGTRARINVGDLVCVGGHPFPEVTNVTAPDPCVPPGCNEQDDYGTAISYTKVPGTTNERIAMTFYSGRSDPNNRLTNMYMMYSENGGAFTSPSIISIPTFGTTETVPWDHTLAAWGDYQALSNDPLLGTFLGAWGGDARLVPSGGPAGIWSVFLQ